MPGKVHKMEKMVLSVSPEVFRARKPGEKDTPMWRVYMADEKGRVGYLYSRVEVAPGDLVRLGLRERDGRLNLCVVGGVGNDKK